MLSIPSSADTIANIINEFSKQSLQSTKKKTLMDDSHEELVSRHKHATHAATNEHLIYFDFTTHLSVVNKTRTHSHSNTSNKVMESLFKLLILCVDKYGAKNVKVISSANSIAATATSTTSTATSSSCVRSKMGHQDLMDVIDMDVDIGQLLKYKIDVLCTQSKPGDIAGQLDDIVTQFRYVHRHSEYRKISIVGMTETETLLNCVEYSLVDSQRITQSNRILHAKKEAELEYILSLLDEYFFGNDLSCSSSSEYSSTSFAQSSSHMMNDLRSQKFAMPAFRRSDSSVFC